jgi:threonine dehydrogenase-like Zn-dependent dehydrogenase
MFAGHMPAPGRVELIEVPEPVMLPAGSLPDGAGEIVFQPEIACLCGSDVPFFERSDPSLVPEIGHSLHEMVGHVVDTNGQRFRPGDRVLVVPVYQRGLFERYAVTEERAVPLDRRVPPEQAMMAQPLGTVLYALKKLPNLLDLNVAVVGQGPIGQLFNMALRNMGAREIIGIDLLPDRLAHSLPCGATATVCNAQEDPLAAVERILHGELPDVVVECVGHHENALNLCIALCRKGGRILYFGVPTETIDGARWRDLWRKNLTVHTSVEPDFRRDFPLAMRWIGEGRVDVTRLLTHRFPLSQLQTAFELFRDRREGCLKVVLDFPRS